MSMKMVVPGNRRVRAFGAHACVVGGRAEPETGPGVGCALPSPVCDLAQGLMRFVPQFPDLQMGMLVVPTPQEGSED